MKAAYLLSIGIVLISACSTQKFVKFSPKPEVVTTKKLETFLKENKIPKVVLRVPDTKDNTTQKDNNDFIYNIIEKEFLKAGYIVRDRALFSEIVKKSGEKIDYSQIKKQTDTDLILELTKLDRNVVYRTNKYYTNSGKEGVFSEGKSISVKGVSVAFKVVLIGENEFAGSYNFNKVYCSDGCEVVIGKRGPKFPYSSKKDVQPYQVVEQPFWEDFVGSATQELIENLQTLKEK